MNSLSLPAFGLDLARILAVAAFLYILPGLAVTSRLARAHPLGWAEHLALASGFSLALYPLLYLWAYTLGLRPGSAPAWALPLLGGGLALWHWRKAIPGLTARLSPAPGQHLARYLPDAALLLLLGLLFATRFLPIRLLTEPFWGDALHHTIITQLVVDNSGLFQSWEPYAPIRSLTYHFGFHIAAAQWMWLTGAPAPEAVLHVGQVMNGLAVLALYPLALRLSGGNRWAGAIALFVAGFWLTMPAYYVNWGRYTQLIGQVMLPALLWLFAVIWESKSRRPLSLWLGLLLLAAGLILTHYRVALLAGAAGAGWGLWGLWHLRRRPGEIAPRLVGLLGAALLAGLLVLPWVRIVRGGAMEALFTTVAQRSTDNPGHTADLALWLTDTLRFYPALAWAGAIGLLALACWRRPALGWPLIGWFAATFLVTNPFLVGLPGTGWVSNFLLIIALYIPLALLWGWAGGAAARLLAQKTNFAPALVGLLLVGLTAWGATQQVRVVDFFHRLVWPADRVAFQWIEANTPADSRFLINGFSIYSGVLVVGSDGGWWLPFFTRRDATVPPASYYTEHNAEAGFIHRVDKVEEDVRAGNGDPALLQAVLCRDGISHVYLGERRGEVGFGAAPLIQERWLVGNPAFALLFQEGAAQVWAFDRGVCSGG